MFPHRDRWFVGFTLLSFALAPYLGQDFFPSGDGGQIKMHVRAQTGTRIEETTRLADPIGEAIHKIIPADEPLRRQEKSLPSTHQSSTS